MKFSERRYIDASQPNKIQRKNCFSILAFFYFFSALFCPFRPKKAKSKIGLCFEFSFTKRHLHTKFQKISSNGLDFGNFFFFAVFWLKNGQKRRESKKSFLQHFLCWEASTYQISENFIKRFGFCQFLFLFFWLFFG